VRVKGSALRARVRWVEEHGDMPRFLEALQPSTRVLVHPCVLANEWYPFAAFIDLNETIDRLYGKGDLAMCRQLGRYGCEVNLTTLYSIFFKLGSVPFIIRRAAAAWKVNYDKGQLDVINSSDGKLLLRMVGWPNVQRAHCLSVFGWIERACELSGGTILKSAEKCRALGDPECEFYFEWK
jgi:hypothetical protein